MAWLELGSARQWTETFSPTPDEPAAGASDAELIDDALSALVARYRSAEIDEAYAAAYADHPLDEPDEWGDLASFREAAAAR